MSSANEKLFVKDGTHVGSYRLSVVITNLNSNRTVQISEFCSDYIMKDATDVASY